MIEEGSLSFWCAGCACESLTCVLESVKTNSLQNTPAARARAHTHTKQNKNKKGHYSSRIFCCLGQRAGPKQLQL